MDLSKVRLRHELWKDKFPWITTESRHAIIRDKRFWGNMIRATHAIRGIDPFPFLAVKYLMRTDNYQCSRSAGKEVKYIRLRSCTALIDLYATMSPTHSWLVFQLSDYPATYGHCHRFAATDEVGQAEYDPTYAFAYNGEILLISWSKAEYLIADHLTHEQFLGRFNHIKEYLQLNYPNHIIRYREV